MNRRQCLEIRGRLRFRSQWQPAREAHLASSEKSQSLVTAAEERRALPPLGQRAGAGIDRVLAEQRLEAQELVVLRQPILIWPGAALGSSSGRREGNYSDPTAGLKSCAAGDSALSLQRPGRKNEPVPRSTRESLRLR